MNNGYFIEGDNVRVYKYVDSLMLEIVCAETLVWERQKELIGATTIESGRRTEVRPRLKTDYIEIGGATTSTNDENISVFHFLDEDVEDEAQDLEIVFTDNDGNERSIRGDFYIETVSLNANTGEASGYNLRLRSSGGITTTELVPPTISGNSAKSDSYTVSAGVIQDSEWIGLDDENIIEVCREGTEQLSMGLPYTFNSGTGTITPDPSTTIDGQRMFVIWTY
jgi:hypothetical protein